jgi:hypothetical protein
MLRDVSMTPFNYLPANQASLFSLARPTKKPEKRTSGSSFRVTKTIPKMCALLERREYNTDYVDSRRLDASGAGFQKYGFPGWIKQQVNEM